VTVADPGPRVSSIGPGSAVDAALGNAGNLYVVGYDGQPHCCASASIRAFDAAGRALQSFGLAGEAGPVPNGSYDDLVAWLPTGRLLAVGEATFTGCSSFELSEYISTGQRLQGFRAVAPIPPDERTITSLQVIPTPIGGFLLAGTSSAECHLPYSSRSEAFVASYGASGERTNGFGDGGLLKIPGTLIGTTPEPNGQVLVAISQGPSCVLEELSGAGRTDRAFGSYGIAPCGGWPSVGMTSLPFMKMVVPSTGGKDAAIELVAAAPRCIAIARFTS
jgi:hypothetical protein